MQLHRSGWVVKRAGSGNRTRMASLEGWSFAIKLYPRSSGMDTNTRRAYMQAIFSHVDIYFSPNPQNACCSFVLAQLFSTKNKKLGSVS